MPIEHSDDKIDENQALNSKKIPLPLILVTWILAFPIGIFLIRQLETTIDWYRPFNTASLILIVVSFVLFFVFAYLGILPIRKQQDKRPGGFLSSFI